jgi:hypothetical protein
LVADARTAPQGASAKIAGNRLTVMAKHHHTPEKVSAEFRGEISSRIARNGRAQARQTLDVILLSMH